VPRPRFLADNNVGRLARWLRALGYDADYRPQLNDAELVHAALSETRVLLTRDRDLTQRRVIASGTVKCVLLRDDAVALQLAQVVRALQLDAHDALTRCIECNETLEAREPRDVYERVPPYVRATQSRYSECPSCGRVYWAGTHWSRMRAALAGLEQVPA
jgi:uncharacterized protein with PIN domain